MNVTVFSGANLAVVTNEVLSAARGGVGFAPTFVLVPDRFTLQAERILLERGGTMPNTRVVTFSMLFSTLVDELTRGGSVRVVDKTTAILYLWRAIKSVKLDWFRKSSRYFDFAEKMFNAINQIKSSLVGFDELDGIAKTAVARKKFADIVKVEKEYQRLLCAANAVDSSGMLSYLIDNVRESRLFAAANFYVCGFDNFSRARLRVIEELTRRAGGVCIGTVAGGELDGQIKGVKKAAKIMPVLGTVAGDSICDVFSYRKNAGRRLDFCEVGIFDTAAGEAEIICNRIRTLANGGVPLGDMTVLLGDFENTATQWEAVFAGNGIPVNIDVGRRLSEFAIARFIRELLEIAVNKNAENTVSALFNRYSGVDDEALFSAENEIIARNPRAATADGMVRLTAADTVGLCGELQKIAESEKEEFVRDKLCGVLDAIRSSGLELSPAQFGELFWALAAATKVSNIPLYRDRVLIAPADDFIGTFVPYLFVCNCADGVLPKGQDDSELLLESDTRGTEISPKPSEQRERNRRHLVDIMMGATQHIAATSYRVNPAGEDVNAGVVIANLRALGAVDFVRDNVVTPGLATQYLLTGADPEKGPSYAAALGVPKTAGADAGGNRGETWIGAAADMDGKISCGRELFFPRASVRPTMVERFYACPYLNFVDNGLRIRQRQLYELKPNVIGSIIHDIIYEYFYAKIGGNKISAAAAVARVFGGERYAFYCTDRRNLPITNAVSREAEFIIDKLEKNLLTADLQPYAVEFPVSRKLPNGYELNGRVDRVDKFVGAGGAEYYAVFDYKTGTKEDGIPKKIYMGEKLQLPLYSAYFLGQGHNIAGAGYLPLTKGFAAGEKNIQLNGFVDGKLAAMFDRKIGTEDYSSKIINEKQAVDGGVIAKICEYADSMVTAAVESISAGHIAPNPAAEALCKYCPVRSVCQRRDTVRRGRFKVNFGSFAEVEGE